MNSTRPAILLALFLVAHPACSSSGDGGDREAILAPQAAEESDATGSSVLCRGPDGSTTTTTIGCESDEAKIITHSDRITVYCPQRQDTAVAKASN